MTRPQLDRVVQQSAFLILLCTAGCSSSPADGAATNVTGFACAFGELTGTWRVHYEETDGSCGPLADETVVLGAAPDPKSAQCTFAANMISDDKCRVDQDFTCPTADGDGTQRWVGSLHHTGRTSVNGSMTVQADHPAVRCRSTYDITWTRQ